MKLPEFKAILKLVGNEVNMSTDKDKTGTKQTIVLLIPERSYTDDFGEKKEIRAEYYECDVINRKISPETLKSLIDKKCVVTTAYLNGFEYQEKDDVGKITGNIKYGKSITVAGLKEFK